MIYATVVLPYVIRLHCNKNNQQTANVGLALCAAWYKDTTQSGVKIGNAFPLPHAAAQTLGVRGVNYCIK